MKKCTFIKTYNNTNRVKSIEDIKNTTIDKNNVVMIISKYILLKQDGYCETLTDDNGNKFEICFHKLKSDWIATEKTTGLIVCFSKTRKSCFNMVCDRYLNNIQSAACLAKYNKLRVEVEKAYELLENKNE